MCHVLSCSSCTEVMPCPLSGHNAPSIDLSSRLRAAGSTELPAAARRSRLPHRLRRGLRQRARALRPASPPVPGSVSGAGRGGGRLQSWFLLAGPGVGPCFRAYRARARPRVCAGAVRAPDCARETAGIPLPSVSRGFRKAAVRNAGEAAPDAPSPAPIIHRFPQDQAPYGNKKQKYRNLYTIPSCLPHRRYRTRTFPAASDSATPIRRPDPDPAPIPGALSRRGRPSPCSRPDGRPVRGGGERFRGAGTSALHIPPIEAEAAVRHHGTPEHSISSMVPTWWITSGTLV